MIREAIETGGIDQLDDIQAVIESTGALSTLRRALKEAADIGHCGPVRNSRLGLQRRDDARSPILPSNGDH